jgi:hypothetical protein
MTNITSNIQTGKGSAINRLRMNEQKAIKRGDLAAAERFRQAQETLINYRPTIWG